MKFAIVLAALIAVALAAPVDDAKNAQVLRYENDNIGVEGYNFGFETSNGISQSEQGTLKQFDPETSAVVVRGTVSWVGADGEKYTLNYVADENGFQPEGAHLPKA